MLLPLQDGLTFQIKTALVLSIVILIILGMYSITTLNVIFSLLIENKIENGNGECVKETTTRPTAEGHQQVFNAARNSHTRRCPSAGP